MYVKKRSYDLCNLSVAARLAYLSRVTFTTKVLRERNSFKVHSCEDIYFIGPLMKL